jgi:hypothetical protein
MTSLVTFTHISLNIHIKDQAIDFAIFGSSYKEATLQMYLQILYI